MVFPHTRTQACVFRLGGTTPSSAPSYHGNKIYIAYWPSTVIVRDEDCPLKQKKYGV